MSSITKSCEIVGCTLKYKSNGLCNKHAAAQWYRENRERLLLGTYNTNVKHRGRYLPEYNIWTKMKARCYNPNDKSYFRYGGRGITICDRWLDPLDGFENFILDMDWRPSSIYSINRIDNDGNYEPNNCNWATAKEQANNRRKRSAKRIVL